MYSSSDASSPLLNLVYSLFVGIVQGIAEWLPISSKTQVLFISTYLFALPVSAAFAFGLFMEVGSLGSASFYFRRDIVSLVHDTRLLLYLAVVTLATGAVGVPLYLLSERLLRGSYNLGIPMIVLGGFLIIDSAYIRLSRRRPKMGGLKDMKLRHYLAVGIAQGIAALPGVSRSGMTISTMFFMGVDTEAAFRLSYLAYIPASLGAFATSLLFSKEEINLALSAVDLGGVVVAVVSAAIVGLIVISALLKFAKKSSVYVVTLAIGILALSVGTLAAASA